MKEGHLNQWDFSRHHHLEMVIPSVDASFSRVSEISALLFVQFNHLQFRPAMNALVSFSMRSGRNSIFLIPCTAMRKALPTNIGAALYYYRNLILFLSNLK